MPLSLEAEANNRFNREMTVAGKITIREVARLAEVSVGTVSNVLNGAASVSDATRQRRRRSALAQPEAAMIPATPPRELRMIKIASIAPLSMLSLLSAARRAGFLPGKPSPSEQRI